MALPDLPRVAIDSRAAWRAWLVANHAQTGAVWLVTWRKGRGPYLAYGDVVDEALCFGWIDSRPAKLDENRTMLLLAPRRPKSAWSAVNKARIEKLAAANLIAPAGLAAIERAKADGSWTALDGVETLVEPDDLALALATTPGAAAMWARIVPSSRRGILEWITAAKQPQTRAKRIEQTATLAAEGRKANHPVGRDRIDPLGKSP
jgi:uncharacterized protein YdeI (YjbR/CyaY-like superfamily)